MDISQGVNKALFVGLFALIGLYSCSSSGQELSTREAEQQYLAHVFQKGVPQAGYLKAAADDSDLWTELQVVWFDSLKQEHHLHSYENDGSMVHYQMSVISAQESEAIAAASEALSLPDRNLVLPDQNSACFIPLHFWSFSFNQSFSPEHQVKGWENCDCDRPRRSVYCFKQGELRLELGLFSLRNPRIRAMSIKGLSQDEAIRKFQEIVQQFKVEPDIINWTTFAKKPLVHGFNIGDLFTLNCVFQSPYPAFRFFYTYMALNQELQLKIENTRPTYVPKQRRKKLCAFGEGSDYACEFISYPELLARAKTSGR